MRKHSLMIIDDNEDDRYLLKRLIKKAKIKSKIFEAENGQVALDFFTNTEGNLAEFPDTFPPLLIFLDINMPIMDGFEFLENFRKLKSQRENLKAVIFAMFTSSERKEDLERAQSYKFVQGFITKGSLTVERLRETIMEKFPEIEFEE